MALLHVLVPGDWHQPTGGYAYDRRMARELAALGWTVHAEQLAGPWPTPDPDLLARTHAWLAALPDHSLVLADGLAFGGMPELARFHAGRLRWAALVHHPLHLETGLDGAGRLHLRDSETRALQWARGVVVTSRHTVRDLVAMGVPEQSIAVVEPGTERVPGPGMPPPHRAPGPVRLLCVATVTPRKGHAVLLEALADLPMPEQSWELHNVGSLQRDPDHAHRMQTLAAAMPCASQVTWHGEVDDNTLRSHYDHADVLVLPSLHEGFGMVVTEAVAHGLPVVTTDGGALADTLPPGAGLVVPAGNAPALRAALHRVLHDTALRNQLASGARQAALSLPDWPQQAARLSQWLHALP
ncbi:MAG: glycosyltransferase family 4 protein [Hydrogenophaga sp.]